MKREFKGLLKSEIKKAVKAANKFSGYNDCEITTGKIVKEYSMDLEPGMEIVDVFCNVWHNGEKLDFKLQVHIPMWNRRNTKVIGPLV